MGAALAGCAKPPTDAECLDLVERYAQKLLRSNNPDLSEAELVRLQHEARSIAAEEPMMAHCRRKASRHSYDCAMHAPNPDEMEKCLLP
jgi:hypothetical protein